MQGNVATSSWHAKSCCDRDDRDRTSQKGRSCCFVVVSSLVMFGFRQEGIMSPKTVFHLICWLCKIHVKLRVREIKYMSMFGH